MKTIISKLAIALVTVITMVAVMVISSDAARRVERYQAAHMSNTQPGPEIIGNSVGAVMDSLLTASGR